MRRTLERSLFRHGSVVFALSGLALAAAPGCSSADAPEGGSTDDPSKGPGAPLGVMRRVDTSDQPRLREHLANAPPGAHLSNFGGRVISNVQVVQVLYGTGSYLPQVTSTAAPSMATFYQSATNSTYFDMFSEYNTSGAHGFQAIGRGSFWGQVQITPAAANNGSTITDANIQAELAAQITAGVLPRPQLDAGGNSNTYYAIFFPHGKRLTLNSLTSCVPSGFCAYHGTIASVGGREVYYGVHPDLQVGSGCEVGCGTSTTFGNQTSVASHELVEATTDAEVGLTTVIAPPLAWYDPTYGEIGDICTQQQTTMVGNGGVPYTVQREFSNSANDCIGQDWESMGGSLTSGPGVSSWGSGRLDMFARGTDNAVWHRWFDVGGWRDWESMGGTAASDPAAVSWSNGHVDLLVRRSDNAIWRRVFDGGVWHDWESLGGNVASGPAASSWGFGRLDIFTRGFDNAIWHKSFDGGWSGWESLGGTMTSDPAAVSWGSGRIDLFARGSDGSLQHKAFDGTWSGWESLGGVLASGSGPAVSSWAPGRLDVFARGLDNALWHKTFAGTWLGWESLGGWLTSDPDAVSWGNGRIDVFARNADTAIWHKWFDVRWMH